MRSRFQYPEQFLRNLQNLQKAFLLTGIYTDVVRGKMRWVLRTVDLLANGLCDGFVSVWS